MPYRADRGSVPSLIGPIRLARTDPVLALASAPPRATDRCEPASQCVVESAILQSCTPAESACSQTRGRPADHGCQRGLHRQCVPGLAASAET